jgi:hypothetical protein
MEDSKQKKEEWNWAKHMPNNCLSVPTTPDKDFFKWWCIFQCPFVPLTNREIDVIAAFLRERFELAKIIPDSEILDSQLMSKKTVEKVIESCNITRPHFYVIMSTLKKKHIITDTGIQPKLIPNIRENDNGHFQLLILFKEAK